MLHVARGPPGDGPRRIHHRQEPLQQALITATTKWGSADGGGDTRRRIGTGDQRWRGQ